LQQSLVGLEALNGRTQLLRLLDILHNAGGESSRFVRLDNDHLQHHALGKLKAK
jgi:hypothetical protein